MNKEHLREQIECIVQGIGSPWGEGATYKKLEHYKVEDGELTHLDESDADLLRADIESLIKAREKEAVEEFVGKMFKEDHRYTCWVRENRLYVADEQNFTLIKSKGEKQ